ncbi:MAG: hypothetical protein ACOYNN_13760 [Terrimicrobiaceae bacterium]
MGLTAWVNRSKPVSKIPQTQSREVMGAISERSELRVLQAGAGHLGADDLRCGGVDTHEKFRSSRVMPFIAGT